MERMTAKRLTRKHGRGAAAASLITLLGLLIAPVCAPLCAAQACAHPTEAPCHFGGAAHGNELHIRAEQNCRAPELVAADPASASKLRSLPAARFTPTANATDLPSLEPPSRLMSQRGGRFPDSGSPGPCHSLTVVLRI